MPPHEDIFRNNRLWLEKMRKEDKGFFRKLAKGQNPDYLVIGCSDSRVPLETIMGVGPGDLFVHRNIANVVSSSDNNVLSVIEYAVNYLKVKHIVVCGHTACGGVRAAMDIKDESTKLGEWLTRVSCVMHKNAQELSVLGENEKYLRLIELNVRHQADNILSLDMVKQSRQENGYPTVHAWIFDIETGSLIDLEE